MRTEIAAYYNSKGKEPPPRTLKQRMTFNYYLSLIGKLDVGSEKWIELQYKLAKLSSSTFDCELRELFYQKSCGACGKTLCVMPNTIMSYAQRIFFGDFVYINSNTLIVAKEKIEIGNNVLIGPNVIINSGMHNYNDSSKTIREQGHACKPITIQDDVWIGANSVIMPGVTIEKGAIIGAGSIVTHSIPSYVVAVGAPAKAISCREKEQ